MGDGTAGGGRLACTENFRRVGISYPPPEFANEPNGEEAVFQTVTRKGCAFESRHSLLVL